MGVDVISLDVSLIGKEALMVKEVGNEEVASYEEGTSDAVIVGVITIGKETGRVKIKDASKCIEFGTTMGTLTKGMVVAKMGVKELELFVVEIWRDVNDSSTKRMYDDETNEDDTVSGIDGRSDREVKGDEFVSKNKRRLKDEPSKDGGIS
ncbi:hypothetical protein KI387_044197 [Taxus chinensis]|uniref:Uncharacterized protein n=1 Tax=Taxus chinensis TaxID=29808 RepID=A0AA38L7J5_TAXCH|nr:hypothetical protein KI387_044197 [Taxus chinensis]